LRQTINTLSPSSPELEVPDMFVEKAQRGETGDETGESLSEGE